MDKNLILFKSGEGIIEVYNTLFSFTQCIGRIHFQRNNKGVFMALSTAYNVKQSPDTLRTLADVMDELYANPELCKQIGVI